MPYMERLTWGGVAMHAGNLPGYPASHGCVRLPLEFAKKLHGVTDKGRDATTTDCAITLQAAACPWSPEPRSGSPLQ